MWENEIDEYLIQSLICPVCDKARQRKLLPCVIHPTHSPLLLSSSDLLEKVLGLQNGHNQCQRHLLHESRYTCHTCDSKIPICLICFAEDHIGHIIKEISADNPHCQRPSLDDVDEDCDESVPIPQGKRRRLQQHRCDDNLQSTSFADRLKVIGLIPLTSENGPRNVRTKKEGEATDMAVCGNKELRDLTTEAPSLSREYETKADIARDEKWFKHYDALVTYGERNKCGDRPNYNVPKDYVFNTEDGEIHLGLWVSNLNFRTLRAEYNEMMANLILNGSFEMLYGEKEGKDNINSATSKKSSPGNCPTNSSSSGNNNRSGKVSPTNKLKELRKKMLEEGPKIKEEPGSNNRKIPERAENITEENNEERNISSPQNESRFSPHQDDLLGKIRSSGRRDCTSNNHASYSGNNDRSTNVQGSVDHISYGGDATKFSSNSSKIGNSSSSSSSSSSSVDLINNDNTRTSSSSSNPRNRKGVYRQSPIDCSALQPNTCILHYEICPNTGSQALSFSIIASDSVINEEIFTKKTYLRAFHLNTDDNGKVQNCFYRIKHRLEILVQVKDILLFNLTLAKGEK